MGRVPARFLTFSLSPPSPETQKNFLGSQASSLPKGPKHFPFPTINLDLSTGKNTAFLLCWIFPMNLPRINHKFISPELLLGRSFVLPLSTFQFVLPPVFPIWGQENWTRERWARKKYVLVTCLQKWIWGLSSERILERKPIYLPFGPYGLSPRGTLRRSEEKFFLFLKESCAIVSYFLWMKGMRKIACLLGPRCKVLWRSCRGSSQVENSIKTLTLKRVFFSNLTLHSIFGPMRETSQVAEELI